MSDDFETDSSQLEEDFAAASKHLQSIVATVDQKQLLRFYGLYKQATVGRCDQPKPGIFSVQARAKWHAWSELGDLPSAEAMLQYVQQMDSSQAGWRSSTAKPRAQWAAVSQPALADEEPELPEAQKTCADYVREGNWRRCAELLPSVGDLDALDAEGMALIHWAADRGEVQVLRAVLAAGANVDGRDAEGQTALHYACSVGHADCVRTLLEAGADRRLQDGAGETCEAQTATAEIRELLLAVG